MLADSSSGIEPLFALEFNKISMGKTVKVKNKMAKLYPDSTALVTADQVSPNKHIRVQAAWQEHIDAAISKTINVSYDFPIEGIGVLLHSAHITGCKGLTIYRDGSRTLQAQTSSCPECGENLTKTEGCETCHSCGWSKCSLK